jgi:large subunit ribosomal protein L23
MTTDTQNTKKASPSNVKKTKHVVAGTYAHVLRAPRITEKATMSAEKNGYVFNVDPRATKSEVIKAIKEVYGVDALRITITTVVPKTKMNRGRAGVRSGGKKATVWLKKGDTIEIV